MKISFSQYKIVKENKKFCLYKGIEKDFNGYKVVVEENILKFIYECSNFGWLTVKSRISKHFDFYHKKEQRQRNRHGLKVKKRLSRTITMDVQKHYGLLSWNPCQWTLLDNRLRQGEKLRDVLRAISKRPKIKFKSYPDKVVVGDILFEVVRDYKTLMDITEDLQVCSAVRGDLKRGFLMGEHLRYVLRSKRGKIVGTINCFTNRYRKFEIYGLGNKHSYLDKEENITKEALAYRDFLTKYRDQIVQIEPSESYKVKAG